MFIYVSLNFVLEQDINKIGLISHFRKKSEKI